MFYWICPIQETLSKAVGIKGTVKKERLLYLVGQTRVHVDNVQGLGNFMELEVSGYSVKVTIGNLPLIDM